MQQETTLTATFVYVSVDPSQMDPTAAEQVRSVLFGEMERFGGTNVLNTGGLVVSFEDTGAVQWVESVSSALEKSCHVIAFGIDRGVGVTGVDFLTGASFVRSDAIDRARELARVAGKGRLAVGIDAILDDDSWTETFDLTFDQFGGYRCKTGSLTLGDPTNEIAIPEHSLIARDGFVATLFDVFSNNSHVWLHGATVGSVKRQLLRILPRGGAGRCSATWLGSTPNDIKR